MKYFLVHGEDTDKSYKRLQTFVNAAKKRNWEIVYLDESTVSIKENLSGSSLFGSERFYIHRNFKKLNREELNFLTKNTLNYEGNLILYSDTTISATEIKKFPKDTKIEEFKLPVIVWNFLDSIYPGNTKQVISVMDTILERDPPEKLLGLISWHLKDLYWVKKDQSGFTNQSWRLGKLKSQSSRFKDGQLENLIKALAEIDVKSKTTESDLTELLDLVFIEKLE